MSSDKKGKLYFHGNYKSNRCVLLLRELGALEDFELIDVNVWDKSSEEWKLYKEIVHPHGTIPALQYGDSLILESGAICMFLAQQYQALIPSDLAKYYNLMFYICATIDEVQEVLLVQYYFNEPQGKEDKEEIRKATSKFNTCMKFISSELNSKGYICGDSFSVVDCVLSYNLYWASEMKEGVHLKDFPELISYLDRLKQRPAFQKTFTNDD